MKFLKLHSIIFLFLVAGCLSACGQTKVLVTYYSRDGHTKALAEAVAKGAQSIEGITVRLIPVGDVKTNDLLETDAIIVGSPVYNANVAPEVSAFFSTWPFEGAPLKDKVGAAFATGGGISAGEELTQLSILHSMLIFGMVIVGGPTWEQPFGASAITHEKPFGSTTKGVVDEMFLEKGTALGKRVAEIAKMMKAKLSN
ncbi:MAG: NAD(P)H-dependent oxidoreductase [Bacteroidales bacterium]|nr:NAD(P)H-dependent oxidoreductase [Bacteroidales bacterium]MDZ4203198.1 NAD(P)H-dependent oxidoreductase [Bacteroidales bacterium]